MLDSFLMVPTYTHTRPSIHWLIHRFYVRAPQIGNGRVKLYMREIQRKWPAHGDNLSKDGKNG
jgi:hypothetical protein